VLAQNGARDKDPTHSHKQLWKCVQKTQYLF